MKHISRPNVPSETEPVLLAFGANLGDPCAQIRTAWERISHLAEVRPVRISSPYETIPVGGPKNQPKFFNFAGFIETSLSPEELLEKLQDIETALGRVRMEHWGPRTIDIDVIFYGSRVINTDSLTIPHPRMHERSFVLDPCVEIAPEALHPIYCKTVAELREMLREKLVGSG